MPHLGRHFVEWRVARDAGVGNNDFDGAQIRFDLRDTRGRAFIIAHVPLVGFDAGFGCELGRGFVVAGISGSDCISVGFQLFGNGFTNTPASAGD